MVCRSRKAVQSIKPTANIQLQSTQYHHTISISPLKLINPISFSLCAYLSYLSGLAVTHTRARQSRYTRTTRAYAERINQSTNPSNPPPLISSLLSQAGKRSKKLENPPKHAFLLSRSLLRWILAFCCSVPCPANIGVGSACAVKVPGVAGSCVRYDIDIDIDIDIVCPLWRMWRRQRLVVAMQSMQECALLQRFVPASTLAVAQALMSRPCCIVLVVVVSSTVTTICSSGHRSNDCVVRPHGRAAQLVASIVRARASIAVPRRGCRSRPRCPRPGHRGWSVVC